MYTIGVKRRFFPGFKRYQVTSHFYEELKDGTALVLGCEDHSNLLIPLKGRAVKVFPDWKEAQWELEKTQAHQNSLAAKQAEDEITAAEAKAAKALAQAQVRKEVENQVLAEIRANPAFLASLVRGSNPNANAAV